MFFFIFSILRNIRRQCDPGFNLQQNIQELKVLKLSKKPEHIRCLFSRRCTLMISADRRSNLCEMRDSFLRKSAGCFTQFQNKTFMNGRIHKRGLK